MPHLPISRWSTRIRWTLLTLLLFASNAFATGTGGTDLPWNAGLQTFTDNLTGPTAQLATALMFVIGGVVWGFTRHEEGAKRIGQAIFGCSIILAAPTMASVLGITGALV